MKQLTTFLKKLHLGQILTVFLASVLLFFSTACNSGTVTGALPENPPMQAGGMNNPHKDGGDGYTNFKASTDSHVNNQTTNYRSDRADVQLNSNQLIAANREEILYPGAEEPAGTFENGKQVPIKTSEDFEQPQRGGLNQRNPDLGDRVSNRLETVKEAFGEASGFLKDKADEAQARPEMKANPARER